MCFREIRTYLLCGHTDLSIFQLCSGRRKSPVGKVVILTPQKEKSCRGSASCPLQTSAAQLIPAFCPMCNGKGLETEGSPGFGRKIVAVDSDIVIDKRELPALEGISSASGWFRRLFDDIEAATFVTNTRSWNDSALCSCDRRPCSQTKGSKSMMDAILIDGYQ